MKSTVVFSDRDFTMKLSNFEVRNVLTNIRNFKTFTKRIVSSKKRELESLGESAKLIDYRADGTKLIIKNHSSGIEEKYEFF